jgi:hypothetical protein
MKIHFNGDSLMLYNQVVDKYLRLAGVVFIVVCLLFAGSGAQVEAQAGESWHYFPDTGHNLSGDFWSFYQSIPNAGFVFGSPITEQFTDAQSGRLIQYFQRSRFEFYPENAQAERVVISDLGTTVFQHVAPVGGVNSSTLLGCRFYSETGFSLCYAFLEFFDRNGGEAVFGKPISAFVFSNERIVQYFERARFDWYPEYPEGQKVVLAQLGRMVFDILPEDANRLQPVRSDNQLSNIESIQARVFAWKTLTQANDQQAIYVVVQDQTLNPVPGATTVVTITWADGEKESFSQNTNEKGVVILPLTVSGQAHGSLIIVEAEVIFLGLTAHNVTSFRIWE